jgi:hypothetical protein
MNPCSMNRAGKLVDGRGASKRPLIEWKLLNEVIAVAVCADLHYQAPWCTTNGKNDDVNCNASLSNLHVMATIHSSERYHSVPGNTALCLVKSRPRTITSTNLPHRLERILFLHWAWKPPFQGTLEVTLDSERGGASARERDSDTQRKTSINYVPRMPIKSFI